MAFRLFVCGMGWIEGGEGGDGVMGSPRPSSGDVGGGCPMAAWE